MNKTKHRLIATLLVNNGVVVQTRQFKRTNMVGNAFTAVDFFNGWSVDEIMVLDISYTHDWVDSFVGIVEELSRRCFVPLSVGGKIQDLNLVRRYTRAGADKIVLNTYAVKRPELIQDVARDYGSQCCVVSIDVKADSDFASGYRVVVDNGREVTDLDAIEWAKKAEQYGAGEIMINNIDYDGDKRGYDLHLLKKISTQVNIPVIAMGGVGKWDDFVDGIVKGNADAVAAGNIFHYTEHSTKKAKEHLEKAGLFVRPSQFYKVNMPRRQKYRPFQ